jgi:hypothetical protein
MPLIDSIARLGSRFPRSRPLTTNLGSNTASHYRLRRRHKPWLKDRGWCNIRHAEQQPLQRRGRSRPSKTVIHPRLSG